MAEQRLYLSLRMLPKNVPSGLYAALIVSEALHFKLAAANLNQLVGCTSLFGLALVMGSKLNRSLSRGSCKIGWAHLCEDRIQLS